MAGARLRILHALTPAPFGGLERVVELLSGAQQERGNEVRVLATVPPEDQGRHPFLAALSARDVPVTTIACSGRSYLAEWRQAQKVLREFRPDLVHSHGFRNDVLTASVARREGHPTVTTVHGFTGGNLRIRLYEWLQTRLLSAMDAVIAVSGPLSHRLTQAGVPAGKVHVIPNAWQPTGPALGRVEARALLGLPEEGQFIGWVGRLSWEKGPDVFLRAVRFLESRAARVVIIGSGPQGEGLRSLARDLGITARLHWVGSVPDAGRLMAAFDCFVMSSRTEGTPMVLLEAMSTGTPIVASSVGGIPDIVSSAEALLVPAEDPAALAGAVDQVLKGGGAAAERSAAAGTRLLERHNVPTWVAAHDRVYCQILGGSGGSSSR